MSSGGVEPVVITSATSTEAALGEQARTTPERVWQTVVWDDPVNLMSYVAYVFQIHFGFERAHAEELMLRVHHRGSAVVAEGAREAMEMHVEAMHGYGLWATVRPAGEA
ncbi:ATP-dependent Clp protease adapter ClpS [Leucobacter sp.]